MPENCTHTQHGVIRGQRVGLIELSPNGMQSRWESCTATGGIDPFLSDEPAASPAADREQAVSEVQCIEKAARAAWAARYNAPPGSWDCAPASVQEAWKRAARAVIKVYEERPPPVEDSPT